MSTIVQNDKSIKQTLFLLFGMLKISVNILILYERFSAQARVEFYLVIFCEMVQARNFSAPPHIINSPCKVVALSLVFEPR